VPTIDLPDDELAAVIAAIRRAIEDDKFPHAPRLDPLKAALERWRRRRAIGNQTGAAITGARSRQQALEPVQQAPFMEPLRNSEPTQNGLGLGFTDPVLFGESNGFLAPHPALLRGLSALTAFPRRLADPGGKIDDGGHVQASSFEALGRAQNRLSSPYLTLHRSWMLCDFAFGQFASTCRSSGNFMSPYFSMSRATL
jgi:hypothetical protein